MRGNISVAKSSRRKVHPWLKNFLFKAKPRDYFDRDVAKTKRTPKENKEYNNSRERFGRARHHLSPIRKAYLNDFSKGTEMNA